jgi:hypothetical protein
VLPGAARRGLRVEDDEVHAEAAQVVAGGEPGLAAADHHHIGALRHETGCVAVNFLRQARET